MPDKYTSPKTRSLELIIHRSLLHKRAVSKVETVVNRRVVQILMDKHKFLQHCLAIKRYLLLGQGDFVTYLMACVRYEAGAAAVLLSLSLMTYEIPLPLSSSDLKKPASTVFRHNLLGTLDRAVRSSNAQFDDPEIIQLLDVRLLEQVVVRAS